MSFDSPQFSILKDAFARRILSRPSLCDLGSDSPDSDLDDFVLYLAQETWPVLPAYLQTLSAETRASLSSEDPESASIDALPTSVTDTLHAYAICAPDETPTFVRKVLTDFIEDASAPPPVWGSTRCTECEICEREVPLTYHHLIPRSTHDKVRKKGWHPEAMLNSVAWLCRPCHNVVHRTAKNEDLARHLYTIPLLLEREDIQRWGKYASRQRFGIRRG
ncbi:unnamed protein product [Mycena citricolor]|uniref:HNH domain-containing protein n=1 Tax=Mycena citricolor TaxID=2018698 RepID=A0AAD2HEM6_9AGAR|nr:unnamed protein product [Mycena citricolor]CAK5273410.1 unnamed protein product [Mycena citricolor]